ncbi:MAG: hypothetical protein KDD35_05440 [Bdellovibrionales bacterium]|nr:hypothetical protein [Bdellovibrionales bacterium]
MSWDRLRIKDLRLRLGWCTANLARHLNCPQALVLSWELGEAIPDSTFFPQLKSLLDFADANAERTQQRIMAENLLKQHNWEQLSRDEIFRLMEKS